MPLRPALLRSHPPSLHLRAIAESSANGSLRGLAPSLRCRARGLHASACWRQDAKTKNHYERLNLRHDATPAEIKKSFYSLSKTHHPDTNPSNPNAADTFSLIAESYTVLSDPGRRAAYDRDVLRLHTHHTHHTAHRGSYHSTHSPAGGRAPSGLSRRRGTFRGPPPSFYRSGGWGAQGDKRRRAHEESTGGGPGAADADANADGKARANPWDSAFRANQAHHANDDAAYGGMGPGSDPFHDASSTPHFDKRGHTRTQSKEDVRRMRRRRAMGDDGVEFEPQTSITGHFFIISGILVATLLAPLVYMQVMRLGSRKDKER